MSEKLTSNENRGCSYGSHAVGLVLKPPCSPASPVMLAPKVLFRAVGQTQPVLSEYELIHHYDFSFEWGGVLPETSISQLRQLFRGSTDRPGGAALDSRPSRSEEHT